MWEGAGGEGGRKSGVWGPGSQGKKVFPGEGSNEPLQKSPSVMQNLKTNHWVEQHGGHWWAWQEALLVEWLGIKTWLKFNWGEMRGKKPASSHGRFICWWEWSRRKGWIAGVMTVGRWVIMGSNDFKQALGQLIISKKRGQSKRECSFLANAWCNGSLWKLSHNYFYFLSGLRGKVSTEDGEEVLGLCKVP